ncbi:RNA polymerase sigma factor [Novipirellula galeiformis]|uniref:RNA polymerase sigma factor n=1 Tax=Novipirellula galeiformis TaxID=2528004 RepID=A0A5C6CLQ3_9BACT|nr:sigma-70 family RNA polymerase sigma factor [Novipirellula galeiformis]TWU25272.1 RNA polymerase sigma factor [Novipirellula galeiformis]
MTSSDFDHLISRLKAADEHAAAQIVKSFETEIRRFIRFRLKTSRMKRLVESVDICQSVFAKFFVDLQREAVCPQSPDQLKALLMTMAKNKLVDKARYHQGGKRDIRRVEAEADIALQRTGDGYRTPASVLADHETLAQFRNHLSEEDRELVEARMQGEGWAELASRTGTTADAMRHRVSRAIKDAASKLGAMA